MRKFIPQTTSLVALTALLFQGFLFAEGTFAADLIEEDVFLVSPSIDMPVENEESGVAEALVEKESSLFRHSTYPAAWTAAQKSNRPILVYIGMPNCPHCVKMVKLTFDTPEVGTLVASSFETVYAGRYSHAKLIQTLDVKWYPTTILVGPNNKVLDVIEGYVDSKTFQRRLQTGLAANSSKLQTR